MLRRKPADKAGKKGEIELVTITQEGRDEPFVTVNVVDVARVKELLKKDEWWPSFGEYGKQMEREWVVKGPEPRSW